MLLPLLALSVAAAALPTADKQPSPAVAAAIRNYPAGGLAAARSELERLGLGGEAAAWELLGELLNMVGAKDAAGRAEACTMYERGAATRADSAFNIGNCYFQGDGRPRDAKMAEAWYEKAIDRGNFQARCALGVSLLASPDPLVVERGVVLCRTSAEAGDANAQTDYAGYLLTAPEPRRDPVMARKLLTAAAAQGQANAAMLLGKILWNGDGTAKDRPAAARAFRQALDGGRKDAALLLGREAPTRFTESPAPRDLAVLREARRWYEVAATGDPATGARAEAAKALQIIADVEAGIARLREHP